MPNFAARSIVDFVVPLRSAMSQRVRGPPRLMKEGELLEDGKRLQRALNRSSKLDKQTAGPHRLLNPVRELPKLPVRDPCHDIAARIMCSHRGDLYLLGTLKALREQHPH